MSEQILYNEDGTTFDTAPEFQFKLDDEKTLHFTFDNTTIRTFDPHFTDLGHVQHVYEDGRAVGIPLSRFDEKTLEELKSKFATNNSPIPHEADLSWYDETFQVRQCIAVEKDRVVSIRKQAETAKLSQLPATVTQIICGRALLFGLDVYLEKTKKRAI